MITITIPGAPRGKGRPRFAKRGNFVSTYTDAKTASYENLVKLAATQSMAGQKPFDGPVSMQMYVIVTPPESWSAKKKAEALADRIMPITKPDLDNICKIVFDGCNKIVFEDDKQIVQIFARKFYGSKSEVVLKVDSL